jgi:hypothetical protein
METHYENVQVGHKMMNSPPPPPPSRGHQARIGQSSDVGVKPLFARYMQCVAAGRQGGDPDDGYAPSLPFNERATAAGTRSRGWRSHSCTALYIFVSDKLSALVVEVARARI